MKISIITCVLNSSNVIKKSINSFQKQVYKNKEHIIIDGGSTDGTLKVIDKLKNKNLILSSSSDKGIFDALNKGINLSSGNIIGILHSDDFYKNNKVLKIVADAFKNNDADLVYGDLVYVTKYQPFRKLRYWKAGEYFEKNLRNGWMPPHPAVFIKKDVFNKIGKYKTNYKISSDYDLKNSASIAIRPEKITIEKNNSNNTIQSKIISASYVGNYYQYIVSSTIGELFVISNEIINHYKVNEEVFLKFEESGITVLKD